MSRPHPSIIHSSVDPTSDADVYLHFLDRHTQWCRYSGTGSWLLFGRCIWCLEHDNTGVYWLCYDHLGYSRHVGQIIPIWFVILTPLSPYSHDSASLIVISCLYGFFSGACESYIFQVALSVLSKVFTGLAVGISALVSLSRTPDEVGWAALFLCWEASLLISYAHQSSCRNCICIYEHRGHHIGTYTRRSIVGEVSMG
jgi:hypothetical protein